MRAAQTRSEEAPTPMRARALLVACACVRAPLQYEPDPRRTVAELANSVSTLALPERETWNVRTETQLYVSRLNDACAEDDDGCAVMLNLHAGFLLEGSRFQVAAAGMWMANTHRMAVYSVAYRLASQGATYADTLDDIRVAARWLRARFPRRVVVVFGASIGAGLLLSLVRAGALVGVADLAVVDSPYTCMQTYEREARDNPYTDALLSQLGKAPSDSPIWAYPALRGEELTPRCDAAPTLPTVVLHSKLDPIVPYEQAVRMRGLPNATVCLTSGGVHIQLLSVECRNVVADALDAAGVGEEPSWLLRARANVEATVVYHAATVAAKYAPAASVLAYLCLLRIDPLLYDFLECW